MIRWPINHQYHLIYPCSIPDKIHVNFFHEGNVTCSAYPIAQLDSIDSNTGELNPVSALNLIVFGVRTNKNLF